MKKIFLTIVIFVTVNNFCFSQEEEQETVNKRDNMITAVHIHPWTVVSAAISTGRNKYNIFSTLYIPLTIEKPLSLSNSLIIKPSFWANADWVVGVNETEYGFLTIDHGGKRNYRFYRFGSDIGIRHYPSGNGEGFYLQAQSGMFIRSNHSEWNGKSRIRYDIMGYWGASQKEEGWFFEIGIGYGNSNPFFRDNPFFKKHPMIFDFNIGFRLGP